jgi:hypothetical protein
MPPNVQQTKRGSRSESNVSTHPKPVISVPQSIPKTRIWPSLTQRCQLLHQDVAWHILSTESTLKHAFNRMEVHLWRIQKFSRF